jgi:formate dehydrogenase major subunit
MTNSFSEFQNAKMFFVIGSNMTEAHPVAATFLKNAVKKGAGLIVADPRAHKLVEFADMHLQLKVGSDVALLNAVMNVLIEENLYDKKYVDSCTTNFEALKEKVKEYPPEHASKICGISPEAIRELAHKLASVKPVMVCYTLGITEHTSGVDNVKSIANLQMLLGNVGVENGGVNPLRGQNNVQGACDMGALPNIFPGYHNVTDPASRKKFEEAWGVEGLSGNLGIMMPDMLDGLSNGKIKAFYVFGENLANTEPNIKHIEKCLDSAEFLVVQDIFPNETTKFADVILPAAAWSENDGTFTNSERRVSRVRTASRAPGQAKPNWQIFKELAERFGHKWDSSSAKEIWDNEVSEQAPILKGIKYNRIEHDGLQWPCTNENHPGTCFLHKDGEFSCGKGRFYAIDWRPSAEVPDEEYPLVLSTGRRLYHYHTRTQTGNCEGFNIMLGESIADISFEDAERLSISQGDLISVESRRGRVEVKARVTEEVPEGMVWMDFHFREGNANWLTNPVFDPESKTAEYKVSAVRINKI